MDNKSSITRRELLKLGGAGVLMFSGCPSSNNGGGGGGRNYTKTFNAVADSYTDSGNRNINYGKDELICTGYVYIPGRRENDYRGFVKFNLSGIPSDARIDSATLTLTSIPTLSAKQPIATVEVEKVLNSWYESNINYALAQNNHYDFIAATRIYLDGEKCNWDVKDAVRDWVGGESNNGFAIKSKNIDDGYGGVSSVAGFHSREIASQLGFPEVGPFLTIDYFV